jgi:hypothetical protein
MGGTCRQEGPIGGNKALGRRTDIPNSKPKRIGSNLISPNSKI